MRVKQQSFAGCGHLNYKKKPTVHIVLLLMGVTPKHPSSWDFRWKEPTPIVRNCPGHIGHIGRHATKVHHMEAPSHCAGSAFPGGPRGRSCQMNHGDFGAFTFNGKNHGWWLGVSTVADLFYHWFFPYLNVVVIRWRKIILGNDIGKDHGYEFW